ncbi:major facilitator superfamily domain-containing protein [Fennellomyces sp. T-0311]|nr:major facilitator superfamily domain-containing protein [Fennellomyces sp. T-0311]
MEKETPVNVIKDDTSYDKEDPKTLNAEKRLLRKLDLHIMPVLLCAELMGRYEQSVVTNAKLGGLLEGLHMTESQYRWCLSAYYVAFFIVNIPINILFRRWRPSIFLSILIFTWGTLVLCMAATTNFAGLLVCRIILGAAEAVYDPVQMMFILFGAPSIVLAMITFWQMPDKPETAKFFTEEERKLEIERLQADQGAANDPSWNWVQVKTVLTDWKTYVYGMIFGLSSIPGAGVRLALPSIIDGMGTWTADVSQALTTPPNIVACIFIFLTAWYSGKYYMLGVNERRILILFLDKWFDRAYFLLAANVAAVVGFLMIMFIPEQHLGARYFTVCILIAATRVDGPIRCAWCSSNFSGLTRRAVASGIIFCIDAIGSAIGGQIYFDPPFYLKGHTIGLCTIVLQSTMILTLRIILKRINKKRDSMTAEEKEREIAKYGGAELVSDRHPDFRYAL